MNESVEKFDLIEYIFTDNLYILSEKNVNSFIRYVSSLDKLSTIENKIIELLNKPAQKHIERIKMGDKGLLDKSVLFKELTFYLWKQKNKRIKNESRVTFNYTDLTLEQALILHRQMIENGYEGILTNKFESESQLVIIYETEIKNCLKQLDDLTNITINDYFSWFCRMLNVIGKKVKELIYFPKVIEFIEYILNNYMDDPRMDCSIMNELMLLLYDIDYDKDKIWQIYKTFIHDYFRDAPAYTAYIIGVRIFGERAKKELSDMNIVGGVELIELLS